MNTLVTELYPILQGMMIGLVTGATLMYMILRPIKPRFKKRKNET